MINDVEPKTLHSGHELDLFIENELKNIFKEDDFVLSSSTNLPNRYNHDYIIRYCVKQNSSGKEALLTYVYSPYRIDHEYYQTGFVSCIYRLMFNDESKIKKQMEETYYFGNNKEKENCGLEKAFINEMFFYSCNMANTKIFFGLDI